ncbi:MAG: HU family DNA-binding protein [Alphaproteobacteria bacterium]|nr:HU family DNA-binding protein [Alphaproteobacteria bacterium]
MNQTDLIAVVTKKTGFSAKDSKSAVQAVLSAVEDALAKGKSVRTTLGSFNIGKRGARKGRNPKTGETINIKASKTVRFKASKTVKDKLNKR